MTVATFRGRSTVPPSTGSCSRRLVHSGEGGYFDLGRSSAGVFGQPNL